MPTLCHCCEKPAAVLFKPTSHPSSWLFRQCDVCLETICADCGDTDSNGHTTCTLCLQQHAINESQDRGNTHDD